MGTVHLHPRTPEPTATLAAYAQSLDADRYRCPAPLDRWLDLLLAPEGVVRVLALTGRGGAGKSAALREAARRATRRGLPVVALDARVGDAVAGVDALADGPARLVVVDEVDALGAGAVALGSAVADLPDGSRVVVAGRRLPDRWLPDALDAIAARVRLAPMPRSDADDLLADLGVADVAARARLVAWAGGLPLALVIGARTWLGRAEDDGYDGSDCTSRAGVEGLVPTRAGGEDLWARLTGVALDDLDPDLLAVLALAPGADLPLLRDLFPGRAAELATALQGCTLVEAVGNRLVLHPTVAELLADRLRDEEPARASATVLRVAGHEHARALAGEPAALTRLAALVRDPGLRAAVGPTAGAGHYADRWRVGDAPVVEAGLRRTHPGAWSLVRPWLEGDARLVRRADGRPVALVSAVPLAVADATTGPRRRLVAPVVAHARAHGLVDRVVVSAFQITFDDRDDPEVAWVRNAAGLAQCGLGNPRIDLANLVGDAAAEREALQAWGYVELPDLARCEDGVPVSTWQADAGPGGMAGMVLAAIAAEQGGPTGAADEDADLVAALEGFWSDGVLAALPSAPAGVGVAEAAAHVRARVRARVVDRLAHEPALLDLVQARYLVAGATHESVMRATYLSRATYFRRLRRVRELLGAVPDAR